MTVFISLIRIPLRCIRRPRDVSAGIGGWKRKSTLRSGTDLNFIFTPALVGALYISIREKYFSDYRTNYFNPADYSDLAKFLHKENVNPEKYLHYVFGILDYKRPLRPTELDRSFAHSAIQTEHKRMVNLKVTGGTAKSGSLCHTCKFAVIRESQNNNRWIRCTQFDRFITDNTYRCSAYKHVNTPDLYDLKQISWVVTGQGKNDIGFNRYSQLSKQEQREFDHIEDF